MNAKPGDIVTAKRAGWDEKMSAEEEFDMEPYAEHDYPSDELKGRLSVVKAPGCTVYLVAEQEADPKTIKPVSHLLAECCEDFDPNEPRDQGGKWTADASQGPRRCRKRGR
jgi:hypothetical protein